MQMPRWLGGRRLWQTQLDGVASCPRVVVAVLTRQPEQNETPQIYSLRSLKSAVWQQVASFRGFRERVDS